MIVPASTEFQRRLHEDRVAQLRASMRRPPSFAPRRTVGAWLVSAGLRLAPETRLQSRLRSIKSSDACAPERVS
jgi:hypothetical protein